MRPLTLDWPKPMVPLGGRPLLEHLVNLLCQHGIREIAINLHYKPEAIVRHFGAGDRFGVSITYSNEEQLLGSAGAAPSAVIMEPSHVNASRMRGTNVGPP